MEKAGITLVEEFFMRGFIMRSIVFPMLSILMATLIFALMPTDAEGAVYEDTVRLHILANSDSEEDQALKLLIRDELLSTFSDKLSKSESADGARNSLETEIEDIENFVTERLHALGYDYGCSVTLGEEWYDTRVYEDFTLPKGRYTSLRVIIGEGEGQNWWCVMYPPLCLDIATESAPSDDAVKKYSDEEFRLVTGSGYNVKFKILEVVSSAFG